jgi:hypothetical protein
MRQRGPAISAGDSGRGRKHDERPRPSVSDGDGRTSPDLGDLVIALLAGTLSSLGDALNAGGFVSAASLVADLIDVTDDYLGRRELFPAAEDPPHKRNLP